MTMFGGGWEIFVAALRSLLARPRVAFGLWGGVGAVFFLLELARSADFHRGGDGNPGPLGGVIIETFLVAIIAVGWHRAVLCPGQRDLRFGRWFRYGLAWFVIGLIIGVLLLPFGLVGAAVIGAARELIYNGDVYLAGGLFESIALWIDDAWDWVGFDIVFIMIAPFFMWLLYRFALGLPHIAVADAHIGYRESWRRTRPLARPIIGLALIASVAQTPLLFGNSVFPVSFEASSVWTDLPATIFSSFAYVLVVLFGAAILTELYRRTEPSLPPEQDG